MVPEQFTGAVNQFDAQSLENQLIDWEPRRQAELSDFVGDSSLEGFLSPDKGHLQEKLVNLVSGN